MSHPLLVEAIETEFVPVAIHNNEPGRDAEVLEHYGEPSWNYPVVRFVDASGADVLPRADRIWDTNGIAKRMIAALEATEHEVPTYLELAELESRTRGIETTTLAMYCFWEGEARLGGLEGVAATRAGWLGGREVVEVAFDPECLPFETLLAEARSMSCLNRVYARTEAQLEAARAVPGIDAELTDERARDAKESDRLYYLRKSPLSKLDLSPLQRTKLNAALRVGGDTDRWLSPRQAARARSRREQ